MYTLKPSFPCEDSCHLLPITKITLIRPLGTMNILTKVHEYPAYMVVEILESEPKWWTNTLTNWAEPSHASNVAKNHGEQFYRASLGILLWYYHIIMCYNSLHMRISSMCFISDVNILHQGMWWIQVMRYNHLPNTKSLYKRLNADVWTWRTGQYGTKSTNGNKQPPALKQMANTFYGFLHWCTFYCWITALLNYRCKVEHHKLLSVTVCVPSHYHRVSSAPLSLVRT